MGRLRYQVCVDKLSNLFAGCVDSFPHNYSCTCSRTYTHTHTSACACYMHTHTHTHTHAQTDRHTHTHPHMSIHTSTRIHTHTHIHIHTYTVHTHVHTQRHQHRHVDALTRPQGGADRRERSSERGDGRLAKRGRIKSRYDRLLTGMHDTDVQEGIVTCSD